jgi:hypothetical protein
VKCLRDLLEFYHDNCGLLYCLPCEDLDLFENENKKESLSNSLTLLRNHYFERNFKEKGI